MKQLLDGIYHVRITQVSFGVSKIKKTPFFCCHLENGNLYFNHRIYLTDNSLAYRKFFYNIVGIKSEKYDGNGLIGAKLDISVISSTYQDKNTGEIKTFTKIKNIMKYSKMQEPDYDNFDDDLKDENSIETMCEIFGADLRDLANDLGKDISDINENDILEYSGY